MPTRRHLTPLERREIITYYFERQREVLEDEIELAQRLLDLSEHLEGDEFEKKKQEVIVLDERGGAMCMFEEIIDELQKARRDQS